MVCISAEDLRGNRPFLFGVIQEALGLDILSEHALARDKLRHDQTAAPQSLDETAEDRIRNAGHRRQNMRGADRDISNMEFLKKHKYSADNALQRRSFGQNVGRISDGEAHLTFRNQFLAAIDLPLQLAITLA